MEYNQISAEDARKEVDRLIEAENVEPRRELNGIYGEIHKAIRDKQYCILAEIKYESTKISLEKNGYKVTIVGTKTLQYSDMCEGFENFEVVATIRIDWRTAV